MAEKEHLVVLPAGERSYALIRSFWESFFQNRGPGLSRIVYDGFDTYEDYVKYGDAFTLIPQRPQ